MKSALVLIDLQKDYLAAPGLEPAAGRIVAGAAALLSDYRKNKSTIIHVRTTVTRDPDNRMPHWKAAGRWICEAGTPGHQFADGLEPLPGEPVVEKQFFSGFAASKLAEALRAAGCEEVILAGVHLHACVRTTALDAYANGFQVAIALNAVGTDDPMHGAITRRYLADRGIRFTGGPRRLMGTSGALQIKVGPDKREVIAAKATALKQAWLRRPTTPIEERAQVLRRVADLLDARSEEFAQQITADVHKPIVMARGEVRRSSALLRATADEARTPLEFRVSTGTLCRRLPLGVIAAITPWNNPLAIAVGKIAPAYLFDNATFWKPAPDGARIAQKFLQVWTDAGGTGMDIAFGYSEEALQVAADRHVDAITVTGAEAAGLAMQEIAARRRLPFQAELGGNNAAIVAEDAVIEKAARQIAEGAFGFAGQRCTANRRVILLKGVYEKGVQALVAAARALGWGDPNKESTVIAPVISGEKANELAHLRRRLQADGIEVIAPHTDQVPPESTLLSGTYVYPRIVICNDPTHEIVQEESFGPILVVQPARDFDEAMQLCNGVRQGLAAALFSNDKRLQQRFLREAQAGILKINQATADADAVSPFGGWKASGVGPAEHGIADREFFTRMQTVYGMPGERG